MKKISISSTGVPTLGPRATEAAAAALLSHLGVSVTGDFEAALRGEAEYYLWHGSWGAKGRFWIPALFRSADLPAAIAKAKDKPRKDGTIRNLQEARDDVRLFHAGLGASNVVWVTCAFCEIDHLSRDEQERRYRALAAATGLKWTLWVFSGGKSIHAYLAYDRLLDPTDPLRLEIQKLLVVCLESDTKIVDAGRPMRLPGWDGPERQQPIMHLDPTGGYAPEDVRDRLLAYAHQLGIKDIDRAYNDLQLAEALEREARHQVGEAAREIQEHAALLRHDRSRVNDNDRDLACAMLGRGMSTIANGSLKKHGTMVDKGNVYLVPVGTLAGLKKWARIAPSCCSRNDSPAAVVLSDTGERPRAWCHRCGHMVIEEVPLDAPAAGAGCQVKELSATSAQNSSAPWRMPSLPTASGVYIVTTPMASGKSHQVQALLRDPSVKSALVICPTISLCDDGATKFGARLYSNHQGWMQVDEAWVVCVPSVHNR